MALAIALVLLTEGRWIGGLAAVIAAAGLTWVGGWWVTPWSTDAYVRRVLRSQRAWVTEARWAYNSFIDSRPRVIAGVQRLRVPAGHEGEHARLLIVLADIARVQRTVVAPSPDQVRDGVMADQEVNEIRQRLSGAARSADKQRYVTRLVSVLDRQQVAYRRATTAAERATTRFVRRLERRRMPPAAADAHAELLRAHRDYLNASKRYHTARHQHDAEAATAAVSEMHQASSAVRAAYEHILSSLEYTERWPTERK